MQRFDVQAIRDQLAAMDQVLDEPLRIIIIGGAAVALHIGSASIATKDIDTWQLGAIDLARLLSAAAALPIGIGPAAVADMPWDFEARLIRILPELTTLLVFLPEVHDLVLSKVVRWSDGDETQLHALHAHTPLDPARLVERFKSDMTHAIGDPRRLRQHFLLMIDALFGDLARARADVASER